MYEKNKDLIEKLDKIIDNVSSQVNIIVDGINKIYEYVDGIEIQYIMENMFQSAVELSKYINNINDYKYYLRTDELELNYSNVYILDLINKIYTIYTVKMDTYNIVFNYNLSSTILNNKFSLDKKYIKQILLNIFDIIINDVEAEIITLTENKILINVEYINNYIEFNIYYTSTKDINTHVMFNNIFDTYYIKYNIINALVNHLKGDIIYYNELDEIMSYNKHITLKIESNIITKETEIDNNKDTTEKLERDHKSIAILSENKLYITIIENALRKYYDDIIELEILQLSNIKFGFNYIKHKYKTIDYIFLDIEYNNLQGLNILNNLYKYQNLYFILTTSIDSNNIENYIGREIQNNRIYIYKKPINEHNINKIKDVLITKKKSRSSLSKTSSFLNKELKNISTISNVSTSNKHPLVTYNYNNYNSYNHKKIEYDDIFEYMRYKKNRNSSII